MGGEASPVTTEEIPNTDTLKEKHICHPLADPLSFKDDIMTHTFLYKWRLFYTADMGDWIYIPFALETKCVQVYVKPILGTSNLEAV